MGGLVPRNLGFAFVFVLATGLSSSDSFLRAQAFSAKQELQEGLVNYQRRNLLVAASHLQTAARLEPTLVRAHAYLGQALFYQNRWSDAIAAFERGLDLDRIQKTLDPIERRMAIDNLGMAYALSGKLKEAKMFFRKAIKEDTTYPFYHYNLACTLSELGEIEGALQHLETAYRYQGNLSPGEELPNPRSDPSFRRLVGHVRFEETIGRYKRPVPAQKSK